MPSSLPKIERHDGIIEIEQVPRELQLADILGKPRGPSEFTPMRDVIVPPAGVLTDAQITHRLRYPHHLRAAHPTHVATAHTPVLDPPLRIEGIMAHKRLRGRGLDYELTVKWLDKPLGHLPLKVSLSDALIKGEAVTRAYFQRWNLGTI
ncbi:hypothetical protein NFJ02_32g82000 [Pycnococcus provasolii]